MKKLALTLLILGCCLGAAAQENDGLVYPNTFYGQFGIGGFGYSHSGEANFGVPAFGLSGGVWLASPLAFQLAFDGAMAPTAKGDQSMFVTANAEFRWDVNSTFFHVYNKNHLSPIPFYPLLGMGGMWCLPMGSDDGDRPDVTFQMMLGLQAPYRLTDHMDLMLHYKCYILPQGYDNSHGDNYMHMLGVGLQFRQATDPYHRRTERYTRGINEDWFFAIGIGPNYSAFEPFTNPNRGGTEMLGAAPEIMFGRNFSNFWSVRFVLNGLTAHEQYDTVHQQAGQSYRYSYLHADLMLNVSNLIFRGRGVRFNAMPYLGAGPVWRYDQLNFDVAANAGITLRYYLTRKSDIYADLRYVMVEPAIGGGMGPKQLFYGVGLPSITVGYIYNFGQNSTRYRQPLDHIGR